MATPQKFPKRRGRQHVSPPPTTQSSSPLEAFFANYSSEFRYNPTASASWEFYRLCDELGWDKEDSSRKEAHQNFKDALVQQFNVFYGTDVNDLKSWQNLCYVVHIDPIPEDLHACREASRPVLLAPVSLAHWQLSLPDMRLIITGRLLYLCQPCRPRRYQDLGSRGRGVRIRGCAQHVYNVDGQVLSKG